MKYDFTAPIAVLDSGIGGIGVLQELQKALPFENFIYYANTAMAPYGEKPRNVIENTVFFHGARLLSCAKALVLACNTATAVAGAALRRAFPHVPIIGMEPAVKPAMATAPHPRILLLATEATLREQKLNALLTTCQEADIIKIPAPKMVTLVEAGLADSPQMDAYLKGLLSPFLTPVPDAVVLGCTHFPFAKNALWRLLGSTVPLFDGARGTALEAKRRLTLCGLLSPGTQKGAVCLSADTQGVLDAYRRHLC